MAENKRRAAVRADFGGDFAHILDEAHVEHAVGFVEHQELGVMQLHRALVHQVEQAARGGDEEINAGEHFLDLQEARHAAEHQRGRNMRALGEHADAFLDLHGEFARRHHDERARRVVLALVAHGHDVFEDRQHEGRRLAGAGLGDAQNVAALQLRRDRLGLDRRRRVKTCGIQCLQHNAGQAHGGETVCRGGGIFN